MNIDNVSKWHFVGKLRLMLVIILKYPEFMNFKDSSRGFMYDTTTTEAQPKVSIYMFFVNRKKVFSLL